MTTEEKLQNFYNHSLDSANREAERVIGDHQKALDKIFEEHKATARRQAEEEVAAEIEKAKRKGQLIRYFTETCEEVRR